MVYFLIFVILFFSVIIVIQHDKYLSAKFLLNRTNEINNRMINISEELSRFNDIDILYKKLLLETISLIEGAECGSILIYNSEKDHMDYKACVGFDEEVLRKVHLKKEELFLYETTKLKYPDIIVNPLLYDKAKLGKGNFQTLVKTKALEIKTSLSAPLYINGEFYGMINVDSKTDVDAFKKNDIKLITYISRELEIAIKNANLMNELVDALNIDKLTNIYNRRYFEGIMEKLIAINKSLNSKFSVIMIDLDNFKNINDTYGHKVGDIILTRFAQILIKSIREGDMAVRYAGDEFVLFLKDVDKVGAQSIIERIRKNLEATPYNNIELEFSAGICEYGENMSLDEIMTLADNNMYKEKRSKKY